MRPSGLEAREQVDTTGKMVGDKNFSILAGNPLFCFRVFSHTIIVPSDFSENVME